MGKFQLAQAFAIIVVVIAQRGRIRMAMGAAYGLMLR